MKDTLNKFLDYQGVSKPRREKLKLEKGNEENWCHPLDGITGVLWYNMIMGIKRQECSLKIENVYLTLKPENERTTNGKSFILPTAMSGEKFGTFLDKYREIIDMWVACQPDTVDTEDN